MKKNRMLLLTVGAVYACLLAAQLTGEDQLFSRQENRLLAQKPVLSGKEVFSGAYGKKYETWLNDQFPFRNVFLTVKTETERLFGRKDVNGVYFSKDGALIERHPKEAYDRRDAQRKTERLAARASAFAESISGRTAVMLVPSADAVQIWRMPAFAEDFDQLSCLEDMKKMLGGISQQDGRVCFADAAFELLAHTEEYIYYGTDHHWTTLGAFYGFRAFCGAMNEETPEPADYRRETVTDSFTGTLHAKVNVPVAPDRIEIFRKSGQKDCRIIRLPEGGQSDSLYFYEKLGKGDDYSFFLGGNEPLLKIEGNGPRDKSLLLIKDSYANCMVPFLAELYGTIYAVDERYYRRGAEELVVEYEPTDILILYELMRFLGKHGG